MGELDKQWREDNQQPPMLRALLSLPTETTRLIGAGSPNDAPPFHLLPLEIELFHMPYWETKLLILLRLNGQINIKRVPVRDWAPDKW